MSKCVICNKEGIFKIKGEDIFYCKTHAKEFFPIDALENVSKLEKGAINAEILKKFILNE